MFEIEVSNLKFDYLRYYYILVAVQLEWILINLSPKRKNHKVLHEKQLLADLQLGNFIVIQRFVTTTI